MSSTQDIVFAEELEIGFEYEAVDRYCDCGKILTYMGKLVEKNKIISYEPHDMVPYEHYTLVFDVKTIANIPPHFGFRIAKKTV